MIPTRQRKHSALYHYIAELQGDKPWGALLDAGTGINSIRWIEDLDTESWTAVTGSMREAALTRDAKRDPLRPSDQILIGNWADPELLEGQVFDTVIADYLLGAVEGFAPYFQPYLFERLRPLTRSRLYVTGAEPYVPTQKPEDASARIIWEIGRFRDSCVLLSGAMPYREYPSDRAVDQIRKAGFDVTKIKHFRAKYKDQFVNAQIDIAVKSLERLEDQNLVQALTQRGETLRAEALTFIQKHGALNGCRDYVIAAVPTR